MGCSTSKDETLPIVSLCRHRRDLIRSAADRRYDLASAHISYFNSLERVGEALQRFVTEELTAVTDPSSSPVLTLPPSDGKSKSKSDGSNRGGDRKGGDSNHIVVDSHHISIASETTSSISILSSGSSDLSQSHLHENADPGLNAGFGSEDSFRRFDGYPPPGFMNPNYLLNPNEFPNRFDSYLNPNYLNPNYYSGLENGGQFSQFGSFPNYYFNYMKKSTTTPSTFYVNPNVESFRYISHYSNDSNRKYNKKEYSMRKEFSKPSTYYMDPSESYGYGNYHSNNLNLMSGEDRKNVRDASAEEKAPPPMPEPEISGWDFLNVFDTYEQYLTYSNGSFGSGISSSTGSSEIREKEGIPDLEEETEPESFREVPNLGAGTSKNVVLEEEVEEKPKSFVDEINVEEEEVFVRKKGKSFEEDEMIKKEDSCLGCSLSSIVTEKSGLSNGIVSNDRGTKDVVEAVEEIKEQFKSAAGCGEEVARLLEVGKMRYRARSRFFKAILSRILDSLALSLTSVASIDMQHPDTNTSKQNGAVHSDCIDVKSKNLSATLEKLYAWEKKLYKEIKDEEKLRVSYEKHCRRLKALDDGGAESFKIDSVRAAIKKLLTKISIAIKSVDAISSRIHNLRDEELRPQLIDLLRGLMTMWSSMLTCHQKQFQAIAESKSHNLTVRSRNQSNSVAKATKELEKELLNWSSCFQNWIHTQRNYIESLNGWLLKWLLQEQEETPDGFIPFSPSQIGAPTIFVVSNDWQNATERVSEDYVMTAMQIFTDNVHQLYKTQYEEQNQKLRAEYLSRDYHNSIRSHNKGNELADVSLDKRYIPIPNGDDQTMTGLDAMRKRLDEEMAKHQEIMKHIQEVTYSSLQMSLVTIFEALKNYTTEMLRAYEGLRIPRE